MRMSPLKHNDAPPRDDLDGEDAATSEKKPPRRRRKLYNLEEHQLTCTPTPPEVDIGCLSGDEIL